MKILECKDPGFTPGPTDRWEKWSVNFVDDNNVFVGYDLRQDCCEHAGWYITESLPDEADVDRDGDNCLPEENDFVFDQSFCQDLGCKYEGSAIAFRLGDGEREAYLILFNCHNGYYGHGFAAEIQNSLWAEGTL